VCIQARRMYIYIYIYVRPPAAHFDICFVSSFTLPSITLAYPSFKKPDLLIHSFRVCDLCHIPLHTNHILYPYLLYISHEIHIMYVNIALIAALAATALAAPVDVQERQLDAVGGLTGGLLGGGATGTDDAAGASSSGGAGGSGGLLDPVVSPCLSSRSHSICRPP
jgi:hypothetical protein